MKTLKILLIVTGIFVISSAYSFTLLNFLVDDKPLNTTENPIVLNQKPFQSINYFPAEINVRDNDGVNGVELDEIVISAGQLNSSIRCIRMQMNYPQWPINERLEGIVIVSLVFDSDGNVGISAVNSSNNELANYVTKKLAQVHFNNCMVEVGKEYNIKIVFRLL
jgi:hypothetical protein